MRAKLRVLADFETIVNELLGERIAHNPFGSAPRSDVKKCERAV